MHPPVPGVTKGKDAGDCPALERIVSQPEAKKLDENVCPVVGPVTTVLPPDHPSTKDAKDGDVCPVTNAKVGHHLGKVVQHPNVENAEKGAVCPVVGAKA